MTQFPPLVSAAGPEATIPFQLPTDLTLRETWHTAFNSQANGLVIGVCEASSLVA